MITLDQGNDVLQGAVDVTVVVAEHDEAQGRDLPLVLPVELGHRNVELVAYFIFEAFERLAFVLQRLRVRDKQVHVKKPDMGGRTIHNIFNNTVNRISGKPGLGDQAIRVSGVNAQ